MPPKARAGAAVKKVRRKERKNVAHGQAHIKSTFNNTIVSITDPTGAVISWASAGQVGFKGSRKSTPFAAQLAAEAAARRAMEHGMRKVDVFVKGPGSGRETAIRSLQAVGPRGRADLRRHAAAAQRVPSAEASPGLRGETEMARYTGADCRRCRREKMKLFLKGSKCDGPKCPFESRPFPPGQHGRGRTEGDASTCSSSARSRRPAASTACWRSSSAATTRRPSPSRARPVRCCCRSSSRASTTWSTGPATPQSRDMARQLVKHGHFTVNGKKVDIPSYRVSEHDIVAGPGEVAGAHPVRRRAGPGRLARPSRRGWRPSRAR